MSALTFSLKTALVNSTLMHPINCSALTPDKLNGKSIKEISAIKLDVGNHALQVSELFEVSGSNSQQLVFKNTNHRLNHIGANMISGSISIEGNAGTYLGYRMTGGMINCNGDSGDFAACCMRGGSLTIQGNTGDFLGAATDGLRKGMLGGTVLIKGNAGDRVGDQMRRGLILIEGNVGDYCASRMIAGTIGVLGSAGDYLGFSMRRGTLIFAQQPILTATMQDCGTHTLPFLSLLMKSFADLDTAFARLKISRVQRFVGDAANNGNGEILVITA